MSNRIGTNGYRVSIELPGKDRSINRVSFQNLNSIGDI